MSTGLYSLTAPQQRQLNWHSYSFYSKVFSHCKNKHTMLHGEPWWENLVLAAGSCETPSCVTSWVISISSRSKGQ